VTMLNADTAVAADRTTGSDFRIKPNPYSSVS